MLLAISAVWCHWCHVMDETSYSIPEIIELINDRFVPVRVDNDERPDVNRATTWAAGRRTVFLTPEGEIIHGGTYVPPDQMWKAVHGVNEVWTTKREEITARVAELREQAKRAGPRRSPKSGDLSAGHRRHHRRARSRAVRPAVRRLRPLRRSSRRSGSFASSSTSTAATAIRTSRTCSTRRSARWPRAACTTRSRAASSATRRRASGSIPHYEKMLEDNAELLAVYAEAHRTFPEAGYDRVVRDVVRWMDTVLWRDDVKAFAGSQDADEVYYELDAEAREKHGAPFVDKTLYTGWNALAASAYVAASRGAR